MRCSAKLLVEIKRTESQKLAFLIEEYIPERVGLDAQPWENSILRSRLPLVLVSRDHRLHQTQSLSVEASHEVLGNYGWIRALATFG